MLEWLEVLRWGSVAAGVAGAMWFLWWLENNTRF